MTTPAQSSDMEKALPAQEAPIAAPKPEAAHETLESLSEKGPKVVQEAVGSTIHREAEKMTTKITEQKAIVGDLSGDPDLANEVNATTAESQKKIQTLAEAAEEAATLAIREVARTAPEPTTPEERQARVNKMMEAADRARAMVTVESIEAKKDGETISPTLELLRQKQSAADVIAQKAEGDKASKEVAEDAVALKARMEQYDASVAEAPVEPVKESMPEVAPSTPPAESLAASSMEEVDAGWDELHAEAMKKPVGTESAEPIIVPVMPEPAKLEAAPAPVEAAPAPQSTAETSPAPAPAEAAPEQTEAEKVTAEKLAKLEETFTTAKSESVRLLSELLPMLDGVKDDADLAAFEAAFIASPGIVALKKSIEALQSDPDPKVQEAVGKKYAEFFDGAQSIDGFIKEQMQKAVGSRKKEQAAAGAEKKEKGPEVYEAMAGELEALMGSYVLNKNQAGPTELKMLKALMLKSHPDRNQGDEKMASFYTILSKMKMAFGGDERSWSMGPGKSLEDELKAWKKMAGFAAAGAAAGAAAEAVGEQPSAAPGEKKANEEETKKAESAAEKKEQRKPRLHEAFSEFLSPEIVQMQGQFDGQLDAGKEKEAGDILKHLDLGLNIAQQQNQFETLKLEKIPVGERSSAQELRLEQLGHEKEMLAFQQQLNQKQFELMNLTSEKAAVDALVEELTPEDAGPAPAGAPQLGEASVTALAAPGEAMPAGKAEKLMAALAKQKELAEKLAATGIAIAGLIDAIDKLAKLRAGLAEVDVEEDEAPAAAAGGGYGGEAGGSKEGVYNAGGVVSKPENDNGKPGLGNLVGRIGDSVFEGLHDDGVIGLLKPVGDLMDKVADIGKDSGGPKKKKAA